MKILFIDHAAHLKTHVENAAKSAPLQTGSPIDRIGYMLFLCEGALHRAREMAAK